MRALSAEVARQHFRTLLLGHALRTFGWAIVGFLVPGIAAVALDASPMEMGWLVFCLDSPAVLFSLYVGVVLDGRHGNRFVLGVMLVEVLALIALAGSGAMSPQSTCSTWRVSQ